MGRKRYEIGIDEVGRGCLAGPLYVVAALLRKGERVSPRNLGALRDSKKLSPSQREAWTRHFKESNIRFTIAKVQPKTIDRLNVSRAANLAALRAAKRLLFANSIKFAAADIYLDGGLFLGNGSSRLAAKTVIKGDEKIKSVSIASIIAKVHRDEFMKKLSKYYPEYGFEEHKGYGTRKHIRAIKKNGLSPVHRLTFTKNFC